MKLNDGNYRIIANNLAHTYNLKQDTAGLKYSLQTYRAGKKLGDDHLVFLGSVNTATQYCLRKDWDNAFSYISEALGLVDRFYGKVEVYSVYADVLSALGENAGAEKYYTMALALADSAETVTVCGLCRSYGRFLIKEGRPSEAADIFSKGIALALKAKSYMYRYELYLGLSEALDLTGDTRGALDNFRIYHYLCDSVFNTEKERSMNEMLVKYETEKTARLLQEKSRRLDAAVYVIILMAVIISAVVILSMRRRYMYKQLVARHYDAYEKERKREMARDACDTGGREDSEQVRLRALFDRVAALMQEEKIYRRSDMGIDMVARLLNSNRSYVSAAVNRFSGMEFRQYVNSLRISEAVSMLSDPSDDTPLKAMYADLGFNSASSFYRAFQNATGVPPSQYRKEVRKIRQEQFPKT